MLEAWAKALRECQRDPNVNVVVLTGRGKAFCGGGDISEMGWKTDNPANEVKTYLKTRVYPVAEAVQALEKPLIVAVNGAATGAGMDMCLLGDIRFAAQSARFAETYVKVGLVPGDGGGFLLPRVVGLSKALELLWTGDFIDAPEALRLGIVSNVFPDAKLMEETYAFAERLARGPTLAISLIKRTIYQSLSTDFTGALELVSSHMGLLAGTRDHAEAVSAFMEKRDPVFEGR
jgi:2-(1,2-epoxy-1,2-dihydrophenyl)acetyl-CoA isomerase